MPGRDLRRADTTRSAERWGRLGIHALGTGANLLVNALFEDELDGWSVHGCDYCSAVLVGSPIRSGSHAVTVFDRVGSQTGVQQDVADVLRGNGPGEYTYSAFVRTESHAMPMAIGQRIVDGNDTHYRPAPRVGAGPDTWRQTHRTHNITWSGLVRASLYIESGWGHAGTYSIDDRSLRQGSVP